MGRVTFACVAWKTGLANPHAWLWCLLLRILCIKSKIFCMQRAGRMHEHFCAANSGEMLRFEQEMILTTGSVKYGCQVQCLIVRAVR